MHVIEPGLVQSVETGAVFLTTKISPPQGGKRWVSRTRLITMLGVPPQTRLCLVHAGAGFGKSACLIQWYRALELAGIKAAWLSLDRDDNDVLLFIAYLAAAINRVCPEIGIDVIELAARHGPLARPDALRTPLINAIEAWPEPLVVILDDYHFIEAPGIHEWLTEFITRAPENFHLVLASRSLPPLRLARLQAADAVHEIGASDLALSFAEVREFIQVAGDGQGEVAGQDIAVLHEQTEGWAVGLQMIALALRSKRSAGKTLGKTLSTFSGEARAVSNYLRDEVLDCLPVELRTFLLQTAILDRFCAGLCAAVSGRADAGELLAQAVARELFVLPLDDKDHWHRYHHLFADFLLAQLRMRQGDEVQALHVRACTWFVDHGLWQEAVRHAISSGDEARALDIAERCAMVLVRDGDYLALQAMMAKLPDDMQRHGSLLRLAKAWVLAVNGKADEVEPILVEVAARQLRSTDGHGLHDDEILAVRASLAYIQDDSDGIVQLFARWNGQTRSGNPWVSDVLKSAASANHVWCGRFAAARDFSPCATSFKRVFQMIMFGYSWFCEGRVEEAERQWLEAVDLADGELGARSIAAHFARVPLARQAYERGAFDEVEILLATRIGVLEQVGTTDFLISAIYALAWERYAQGDRGSAIEMFERMRLAAAERHWVRLEANASIELMRICWRTQPDRVAHLAQRLHALCLESPLGRIRSTQWQGRRLCALGVAFQRSLSTVASDGLSGLETVVRDIVDVVQSPDAVTASLLLLIASHQAGEDDCARKALATALARGQKFGMLRTFVDTGDWILPLLLDLRDTGAAANAGIDPGYLAALIASFGKPKLQLHVTPARAAPPALIEPLSKREQDILALVERGLSNKLIGRALSIGQETVKWHLKNLYGKLGAINRQQAVSRARALSLLA